MDYLLWTKFLQVPVRLKGGGKLISFVVFVSDSISRKRFHVNQLTQLRSIIQIYRNQPTDI